jgi:hypothetical protein
MKLCRHKPEYPFAQSFCIVLAAYKADAQICKIILGTGEPRVLRHSHYAASIAGRNFALSEMAMIDINPGDLLRA